MSPRFLVGVDEAGRGPIAGPVAVAAFCVAEKTGCRLPEFFENGKVRDSKKLTVEARERIFKKIKEQEGLGRLSCAVSFTSAAVIDRRGISFAITRALTECLKVLGARASECRVLLDGSLKAPPKFVFQRTIIKGDEKEPAIALASIVAKVSRDRLMRRLAKKYPCYDFDIHKGYGTKAHYKKLKIHGLSPIHRRSFLKGLRISR